ncbi:MAG TPA: MotA/TolQ/ExbB proton channel family protein [Pirellulaceae bacterium]|nr:MotA/TolQ/ExbB proton channel family protein [Pirellulaceae bacterium]
MTAAMTCWLAGESPLFAQETGDLAAGSQSSILRMLFGGSALGTTIVVSILLLSVVSLYSIVDHALTVTRRRIMPTAALDELERLVAHGEIHRALEFCGESKNASLATEVIMAGLHRYQHSEFGFAEYRSAVEEAGEDQTSRLYRRTEVLNVISAIAPMLGLTGTVLGMIEAFNTIAAKEGMATPPELASGIGQALITTLLGLFVAIPSMIALSFFRNKIDSLVAETGKRVERIMMPLGRKKAKS